MDTMDNSHLSILKRVGTTLLIVGSIDIAVMIYCISNNIAYSSSINIFAVVAGLFLLRGNLRAVVVVRWMAVFLLATTISTLIASPFVQPIGLSFAQLRVDLSSLFFALAFQVFFIGLLSWLIRELGREPIALARVNAGRKKRDMRIPAFLGLSIAIVATVFTGFLINGESANRAKFIAEKQLGSSYRFHVRSINITKNNQGTFISGVVTAWNDKEIRDLPVQWEER